MSSGTPEKEEAFCFECEAATLVGVVHRAGQESDLGVLTIVAGGPQYRGGCGRQLVELGRELAASGVHVMRFDHRGIGDASGPFGGFEDMYEDLLAALEEFLRRVPELRRVILWGGCDAASAALIYAHRLPGVIAVVAANPWITTAEAKQSAQRRHYLRRLAEPSFWRKLLSGQYGLETARSLADTLRPGSKVLDKPAARTAPKGNFLDRMLEGLVAFDGDVLFLMSGRSVVSREFSAFVASDRAWGRQLQRPSRRTLTLAEADQTFSDHASRSALIAAALDFTGTLRDG